MDKVKIMTSSLNAFNVSESTISFSKKPIDVFDLKHRTNVFFKSFEFCFSDITYLRNINIFNFDEHGIYVNFSYNFKELFELNTTLLPKEFHIFDEFFDLDMELMFKLNNFFKNKKGTGISSGLTCNLRNEEVCLYNIESERDVMCYLNKTNSFDANVRVKITQKEVELSSFQYLKNISFQLSELLKHYYQSYFNLVVKGC